MIVGLGIDMIDIARVERLVARHPERALQRLFTLREVDYCRARMRSAQHYAARLAAKEAAFKALTGGPSARQLGSGGGGGGGGAAGTIAWKEIEVIMRAGSAPALELHGQARRAADAAGARRVLVSLTHSDHAAAAVVILDSE